MDSGIPQLTFNLVFAVDAGSDLDRLLDMTMGYDFTLLAPANLPLQAWRPITQATPSFGTFHPQCLGTYNQVAFMGRDNGFDLWDATSGATASLTTASNFQVEGISGFPGGVFLVGLNRSNNTLTWNAPTSLPDGGWDAGVVGTTNCVSSSVTGTSTANGYVHQVAGISNAGCGGGFGNVFFGRWLPTDTSLTVKMTGRNALSGTQVHAATENTTATFGWQEADGIWLAHVDNAANPTAGFGGTEVLAVPLATTSPVALGLAVTNTDFVLAVLASATGQGLRLADGGTQPLELGVPLVLWGSWGSTSTWGHPVDVYRVRELRLGRTVVSPVLSTSLNAPDTVYLGGLCLGGDGGVGVAPCDRSGPTFFAVELVPL